jgi:iron complex transport system ATP-binding protein
MMEVRNISFAVNGQIILDNVSLELYPGELLVVLGANGAGKSTLLKCLGGELPHQNGEIVLNKKDLRKYSVVELAQTRAVLTQKFSLNLPFKTEEVVEMGRFAFGATDTEKKSKEIVEQVMAEADVMHLKGRLYTSLSGGEQQRVHFARVLAQLHVAEMKEPRFLFLDEPVSSLDVLQQFRLFDRVKELMKKGVAVLAVVHDLNLACQYADKILAMQKGSVLAYGITEEVLTSDLIYQTFDLQASLVEHPVTGRPQVLFGYQKSLEFECNSI